MNRLTAARQRQWGLLAMRAGGAVILFGSVLPWAYVPLAEAKVPVPGVLGWGAVSLLLGLWLAWRPAWLAAAAAGAAAFALAGQSYLGLPAVIKKAVIGLQWRIEPLNSLLAKFNLPGITLFDVGMTWAQIRGPGPAVVMAGATIAIAGAFMASHASGGAWSLRRCPSCGYRPPAGRTLAFCTRCGAPMPGERACPTCHTLAEPGDQCCGTCGTTLS